jgi:DNA-binding NtrC family response regulator
LRRVVDGESVILGRNNVNERVIVLQRGEPRLRLLGWFLQESGLKAATVSSVEEAREVIGREPVEVVILNTRGPTAQIAADVEELREASRLARIVVIHDGQHVEDDPTVMADVCIHRPVDADDIVEVVEAALADVVPAAEAHAAGEILTNGEA